MFSFKNPLHAWIVVVVVVIVIIIVIRPFPWPPPCLVCGEFLKNFALPLILVALGGVGIIQNLPKKGGGFQ